MRIAFDAKRIFQNKTGLGNYSRTLLDNLSSFYPSNDYLLFTPEKSSNAETKQYAQLYKTVTAQTPFKHIWRSYSIRKDLEKAKVDLYHGLSNEIPFWLKHTKTVVTIHDVIFKILPDTYSQIDRWLYEEKTRYACKYADIIIAISEHTKKDLMHFYDVEAERIKVVYQPCQSLYYDNYKNLKQEKSLPDLVKLAHLPSEFILYVGSIIERKNLLTLVKAFEKLPESQRIPLLVIGNGKKYLQEIQQYVAEHHLEKWIYWIANLSSDDLLKQLYEQAQILIYPSIYEGFGLPVVEAMLCGTAVITSNVSSLPEAGGRHARFFNPLDTNDLAKNISELLTDTALRIELGIKGKADATKRFDPKLLTDNMNDIYHNVVNGIIKD